jgi:hypothetical protein
MKVCPNCNNENAAEARFCIECGTDLDAEKAQAKEPVTTPSLPESEKRKVPGKKGRILFAKIVLILCGAMNIIFWWLWDSDGRSLFIHVFSELNTWLWIALYGRFVFGVVLVGVGILGLCLLHPKLLLLDEVALFIAGSWNILNDFCAVPGLGQEGYEIGMETILRELNMFWLIIGVLQVGIVFFYLRNQRKGDEIVF